MKIKISYTVLFAFLVMCFFSCEQENPQLTDCYDIPDIPPIDGQGPSFGWQYEVREINYVLPYFNPAHSDEFLYIKANTSGFAEMRKHNIANNNDVLIANQIAYGKIRISQQENILFNLLDNQVWSINISGDSLRQLTTGVPALYPEWTDHGNAIIYYSDGNIGNRYFIKADRNGNTMDTLDFISPANYHACSSDGRFLAVSAGFTQKYIYDLQAETLKIINHANYNSAADFMSFSPDGTKLVWTGNKGMYITDISSEHTNTIVQSCDSKQYNHPSISSDGTKILAGRFVQRQKGARTIYCEQNIVIMNIDGSNEHIVELP